MSLEELNTGDILLFSHVPNKSGPFQIFSNFFDFLIKYWTNSKYNHIGIVVRDLILHMVKSYEDYICSNQITRDLPIVKTVK